MQILDAKPPFGLIDKMKLPNYLYVNIYYFERQLKMSSGMTDTIENGKKLTEFLNKIGNRIEQRTFCFAEAFPEPTTN